jgi:two-component system, chemotaxis family, chemotaxis protein CheY
MKLFIIDDDELVHRLYDIYMKELVSGYKTESFYNGLDALRYLKGHQSDSFEMPDIILLDINMPIMDGVEFLHEFDFVAPFLNKIPSIFVVTSSLLDENFLKSFKYVTGVFNKPILKKTLKDMIFNQMQYD